VIETARPGGIPLFDHRAKILGRGMIVGGEWGNIRRVAMRLEAETPADRARICSDRTTTTTDADEVHLYMEESFSLRGRRPRRPRRRSPRSAFLTPVRG